MPKLRLKSHPPGAGLPFAPGQELLPSQPQKGSKSVPYKRWICACLVPAEIQRAHLDGPPQKKGTVYPKPKLKSLP